LPLDSRGSSRQAVSVVKNDDTRSVGELLAAVAGNVAAVPLVLGFVALGGAVLAGRALVDVAGQTLGVRHARRRSRKVHAQRSHVSR
jgi:hypothetical protein